MNPTKRTLLGVLLLSALAPVGSAFATTGTAAGSPPPSPSSTVMAPAGGDDLSNLFPDGTRIYTATPDDVRSASPPTTSDSTPTDRDLAAALDGTRIY